MRLIDADKLSADMYHEAFEKDSDMQKWDSGCWIRYKMFENVLNAQPTVEAPDINVGSMDVISRQQAIDTLSVGAELLRRVLDDADIVGSERAKYEWGLGLIESYISDMKELPSVQPEQTEMIKEIRRWINSGNRGNADYFIVDRIEEIINEYEIN